MLQKEEAHNYLYVVATAHHRTENDIADEQTMDVDLLGDDLNAKTETIDVVRLE